MAGIHFRRSHSEEDEKMPGTYPTIPPAGDWQQQLSALALTGARHRSVDQARSQRRMTAVFVVAIAVGMGLYLAGVSPTLKLSPGFDVPISVIPVLVIVVFMAERSASSMGRAVSEGDDYLAPLGLQTEAVPQSVYAPQSSGAGSDRRLVGCTVLGGERYGRRVEVVMEANRYSTFVGGSFPEFRVETRTAGLVASGDAPSIVHAFVSELSGKRWARLELDAGADGIHVSRRFRSSQSGEALWLSDLWLAECLADRLTHEH
jgi:hypothetical protein